MEEDEVLASRVITSDQDSRILDPVEVFMTRPTDATIRLDQPIKNMHKMLRERISLRVEDSWSREVRRSIRHRVPGRRAFARRQGAREAVAREPELHRHELADSTSQFEVDLPDDRLEVGQIHRLAIELQRGVLHSHPSMR